MVSIYSAILMKEIYLNYIFCSFVPLYLCIAFRKIAILDLAHNRQTGLWYQLNNEI